MSFGMVGSASTPWKVFCVGLGLLQLLLASGCASTLQSPQGSIAPGSLGESETGGAIGALPPEPLPAPPEAGEPQAGAPPARVTADVAATGVAPLPRSHDYVIGDEDEIEISVYADPDLAKTQVVRPGGYITFPLIGTIRAAGLTPEALRQEVAQGVAKYVKDPQVSVIVKAYNSRRVGVLGQVKNPGLFRLINDVTLLDALSRAGGPTEDADPQGSMVLRGQQLIPVDFVKLLKYGDARQNIPLDPGDVVMVASIKDRKVFVIGEVNHPQVIGLKPGTTVVESVAQAGGFTRDARKGNVLLVRGGIGNPKLIPIDVDKITDAEPGAQDVQLQAGDIVYVPRTFMANVVRFFQDVSQILAPFVLAESAFILGPAVYSAIKTVGTATTTTGVVVSPSP